METVTTASAQKTWMTKLLPAAISRSCRRRVPRLAAVLIMFSLSFRFVRRICRPFEPSVVAQGTDGASESGDGRC